MFVSNRLNCLIIFTIGLLLGCGGAVAAPVKFRVIDKNAEPLENAVILWPGPITQPVTEVAIMDQVNKRFVPHVLVIQQGQHVVFPNSDNIRHHVYSFSPAKTFEIKLYAGVPEQPVAFDKYGVVIMGCNIHDSMVGYIVVADTPFTGTTNAAGFTEINANTDADTIRVWHSVLNPGQMEPVTLPLPAADAEGVRIIQLNIEAPQPAPAGNTFGNRFGKNGS